MAARVELRRDAGRFDPAADRWIRKRQVARVLGPPDPATVAALVDHRGRALGHGLYSPESGIVLRLLSTGEAPPPADWLERRIAAAVAARASLGLGRADRDDPAPTTGFRELNSEGDGVPGLVSDRFGDWRVVQITTAPMAVRREAITRALAEHAPLAGGTVVVVPEAAAAREGIAAGIELLADAPAPEQLEWLELGRRMTAPAPPGQKTGAYHDQRDNRVRFAALVGPGARVLDLGCHVGGFAIAAAARGATVVAADRSELALEHLRRNAAANGVSEAIEAVVADMFGELDDPALAGPFDAIVLDPPKIASSKRDLGRAVGALARTCSRLLARLDTTGILAVCSCSHHLGFAELDRSLPPSAGLARVARWGAGVDHPIAVGHREGEYLRVAVYQRRVVGSARVG